MRDTYVLKKRDTILGIAWATPWVIPEMGLLLGTELPIWHANRFWVPNPHQGKGNGKSLVKMVTDAADLEQVVLTLEVQPDYPHHYDWIKGMYSKAGFIDHAEIGGMVRWPTDPTVS